MVAPGVFVQTLNENGLSPFIGVPCSILAPLINYILDNPREMGYYNPANEAHALALASGFYMGTGKIPAVFMQNSGLGNIINPLTSLSQIYKLPALLLITWRGSGGPGTDAPEHDIPGRDMLDYLKAFHIPFEILTEEGYTAQISSLRTATERELTPVAAVIKEGFFASYQPQLKEKSHDMLSRHEAIKIIKESLNGFVFLSTNGFASRESFEAANSPDFYMVGSMGLVSAVGCGTALTKPDKKFAILDGDGAILMHLGMIPFIGSRQPKNLFHFILDNRTYASTQNQPTVSPSVEFDKIALACGYRHAFSAGSAEELASVTASLNNLEGPVLITVNVAGGNKKGTGRVSHSPEEITRRFMEALKETD